MWVSPFRYLRIRAYLQLPAAFRSLSRLSSALSAKASTLRSFLLDLATSRANSKNDFSQASPASEGILMNLLCDSTHEQDTKCLRMNSALSTRPLLYSVTTSYN